MRVIKTTAVSEIKLSEAKEVPKKIQIFKVGEFSHPTLKKFKITTQMLSEFKKNFDDKVRGVDVAVDYFHENDKEAAAWINSLELGEGGNSLWADVDWTPPAAEKIKNRELRYFSPEFAFKWTDAESGKTFNNVLLGGGLTNRPFLKEMQAITADELQGENQMKTVEELQAELKTAEAKIVKLSEEKSSVEKALAEAPKQDKVAELEAKIAALQAELAKEKGAKELAMAEQVKAAEAAKLAEKETKFNVLLSEGKAVPAQKDAFMKDDMTKFIELQGKSNLDPAGKVDSVSLSETDTKAIIKLAEEKQKAQPTLTRGQAILLAKTELGK